MRRDSFERFYYEKVALGEGCGCAEHVTRIRELDTLGQRMAARKAAGNGGAEPFVWLRRLVQRIGSRSEIS